MMGRRERTALKTDRAAVEGLYVETLRRVIVFLIIPMVALMHAAFVFGQTKTATRSFITTTSYSPFEDEVVEVTATVVGSSPTGTVKFVTAGGVSKGTYGLSGGKATASMSFQNSGNTPLWAVYSGDANNEPTTIAADTAQVLMFGVQAKSITETRLEPLYTSAVVGSKISVQAIVTGRSTSARDQQEAARLILQDGGVNIGEAYLDAANKITFTPTLTTAGKHYLQAIFLGTTESRRSSSTYLEVDVQKRAASTVLTSNASSVMQGQPLTLAANVAGTAPTGNVTFFDGSTALGTAVVGPQGAATLQVSFPTSGTRTLTAQYAGDSNHLPSASNTLSQAVTGKNTTTTALNAQTAVVLVGNTGKLTASVSGSNPGGTVTFKVDNSVLGTATVVSGTAVLQPVFSNAGRFALTATYDGDANNLISVSSAVRITVSKRQTVTQLAVSPTPKYQNQSLLLTASISGAFNPTGTVFFSNNAQIIGSAPLVNGQSTLNAAIANIGGYSLSATYSGDANNSASASSSQIADSTQGTLQRALPVSPIPITNFEYDAEGNATKMVVAPGSRDYTTRNSYDSLGRRIRTIDAKNGAIQFDYDLIDQLTTVTDPRNLVTSYSITGLGDVKQLSSRDTGSTFAFFDQAGNVTNTSDSQAGSAKYSYDALNRVTQVIFNGPSRNSVPRTFNFTYDQTGTNFGYGVGRLTTLSSPDASIALRYDALGRVVSAAQTTTGRNLTVGYEYDAVGRITKLTYPSGRIYNYNRVNGLVQSITKTEGTDTAPLLDQIAINPLGQPLSWIWTLASPQQRYERVYDTNGRLVRLSLGLLIRDITYDDADRISRYAHYTNDAQPAPAYDQSFGYDELDRLTTVTGSTNWSYAYDANGNRTASAVGAVARSYTVDSFNNRLTAVTNPARNFAYDGPGRIRQDNETGSAANYSATYSWEGRLASMALGTDGVEFFYDALGRRVSRSQWTGSRTNPRAITIYAYDQQNHLIGEYAADGSPITEYVWLDDIPVAVVKMSGTSVNTYAVHTDHLNTPRILMDSSWQVRWRWMGEPFGASPAEEQPTANLAAVQQNLRFPGQQYEAFGGRHYNHFRDYDPSTGRYVQSDPIGLNGGINTYAYVGGNPLSYVDSAGLAPDADCVARAAVIGAAGGAVIGGVAGGAAGGVGAGAACTLVAPGVGTIGCGAAGGAAGATAGGAKGAVIGGAAGAAVGSLMCSAAKPYVNDPQAQAEHDEYKRNYNSPPPPFNDPCEELRWRLKREEDLLKARQAWDAKWLPGRHAGMYGEDQSNNAIRKLKDKMKQQGCDCS